MTSSLGASFASLAGRVAVAVGRRRGAGPADGGGCIRAAFAPPRRWLCAAAAANGGESSSSSEPFEGFAPETPRHQNTPKRVGPRPQKKTFTGEHALSPAARKRLASEGVRLGKALAQLGVASRRASEDLIFAGRVAVNGVVVTAPQHHVVLADDVVAVDGKVIQGGVEETREHLYFLLNKPKGYICANAKSPNKPPGKGERGGGASGKLVMDLFDEWKAAWRKKHPKRLPPRLFTVGRLDVNTTGMLLVTTDGQWCQRVAHPKSEVVKSYVLTASARPTKAQIRAMAAGAEVDGAFVKPVNVRSMDNDRDGGPPNRVLVEVVDGRNREVRQLASSAGVDCKKLKRVRVGGLRMPSELPLGKYMALKPHQVGYVLDKGLMYNEKAAESSGGKMGRTPV